MAGQKLAATAQPLAHLLLHRVLRDAETRGDLALGQPVGHSQRKHLPAPLGQRLDGSAQEGELLPAADGFWNGITGKEDGRVGDFRNRLEGHHAPPAQLVERQVARRREQQRPGLRDGAGLAGPQHPHQGILHQVLAVAETGKLPVEVGTQADGMRLHFGGKPTGTVGIKRRHDGQGEVNGS